jgi:hypothetical protein
VEDHDRSKANLGGSTNFGGISGGYLPDTRMQIFIFNNEDGDFKSSRQTDAIGNLSWSQWESMGFPGPFLLLIHGSERVLGEITPGYLTDQRMQLFVVGADGAFYSRRKATTDPNSAWTEWVSMGPLPGDTKPQMLGPGPPAIGYLTEGRMQIFYIGNDNSLYSMWMTRADLNSSWSSWTLMGGVALNDVTVGYSAGQRLEKRKYVAQVGGVAAEAGRPAVRIRVILACW